MRGAHTLLIGLVVFILSAHFVSSVPEIRVYETDLISIELDAYDEDGDLLTYYFTPPLDEAGRWQTDYGDEGEYLVDVTVSDGVTSTTQKVKLIVLAKNRPPVIEDIKDALANEGDKIIVKPKVTDYEGDEVTIGISPPVGNDGVWQTDFASAGVYDISVIANDGQNEVVKQFKLTVLDTNRHPMINTYQPLHDTEMSETDRLVFEIVANDPDYEDMTFSWYVDGEMVSDQQRFTYQPGYESAGIHQVKGAVSDGKQVAAIYWNIDVINLNRAPVLNNIEPITVDEGDLINIKPEAYDPDEDVVSFIFSEPFNEEGEWQTTNEDSGIHKVIVTASDGDLEASKEVKIVVKDVDRAPAFSGEIEEVEIKEGDELDLTIGISDPDGDVIALTAQGLPKGATLTGNKIKYKPDFAVIRKPDNWVNSVLQKLHMDWLFSDKKVFKVKLNATSKDLSAKKTFKLIVLDSNRDPVLQKMKNITINENDLIILKPKATDYDNDRLTYRISLPVGNDGEWQTDFDDNGVYNVTISASDGDLEDSQTITITVENINRKPVIEELPVIKVNENELAELSLKNKAFDADGDPITLSVENLPKGAVFENSVITWKPNYEVIKTKTDSFTNRIWSAMPFLNRAYSPDKRDFTIKVIVSDGKADVEEEAVIRVKNVNRLPKINNSIPPYKAIIAKKGYPLLFGAVGEDPDNDNLTYTWKLGMFKTMKGSPVIQRTFTEEGEKKLVLEISDGLNTVTRTWKVNVK